MYVCMYVCMFVRLKLKNYSMHSKLKGIIKTRIYLGVSLDENILQIV